jgi:DNA-binding transcriptional MocR family regulator
VTRPTGGFLLWVELPEAINALELYRQAMQHQISIVPGLIFSATQKYPNCIRLNCGNPGSEEIDQAIATLGQLAWRLGSFKGKAAI